MPKILAHYTSLKEGYGREEGKASLLHQEKERQGDG
jgi:hypothetical protein